MRRWKRSAGRDSVFHDWAARPEGPAILATVWDGNEGDACWHVSFNGSPVVRFTHARSVTAAKRAAERWVVSFARELLIAAGEESP